MYWRLLKQGWARLSHSPDPMLKSIIVGTFHLQLSLGVAPVGPAVVHADVLQGGLQDDQRVFLAILLHAVLSRVLVELNVFKEPGSVYSEASRLSSSLSHTSCRSLFA